jgi:hypothetical protein
MVTESMLSIVLDAHSHKIIASLRIQAVLEHMVPSSWSMSDGGFASDVPQIWGWIEERHGDREFA